MSSLQYPVDCRFLMHRNWSCQLTKDCTMEKYHTRSSSLEPATRCTSMALLFQLFIFGLRECQEEYSNYQE